MNINFTAEQGKACLEIENAELRKENQALKERIEYLERSNNRREDTIISLRDELTEQKDYENVLNKIKTIIDDYYTYDYEDENLERLNVIDKINAIVKESDKN